MSRIIKSNQVKMTDQKVVKFELDDATIQKKAVEVDQNSDQDRISIEIQELNLKKEEILKEIETSRIIAEKEKKDIIDSAKLEYENIVLMGKEESQRLANEEREKGYKEGYESGYSQSLQEYNYLIKEALNVKNSVLEWKKSEVDKLEKDLIGLVIDSIEKIVKIKLKEDDELILNILKEGLDKFTFTQTLIIRVNSEDYDMVSFSKDKILAMADHIDEMEIKVDNSLKKGEIIIDTNSGSINPSITNQLEILKEEFLNLLQSEDRI